jgi:uncharacterized membrane protein
VESLRTVLRWGLAGLLFLAGIAHQVYTEELLAQVPTWLPLQEPTVIVSGLVEVGFAVALVGWHGRRREVGWALASYFALVFVGNVFQAIDGTNLFALDTDVERWGRLFLQPVLVLWALCCTGAWPRDRHRSLAR